METHTTIRARALLKEAYGIMKPRLWKVIGQFALMGVLAMLASGLAGKNALVSTVASIFFSLFTLLLSVRYARYGTASLAEVFDDLSWKGFVWLFLTSLLVGLAVVGGLILLIVPGVILAARLSLAKYYAADKQLTPLAAWRESMRRTKGRAGKIFVFFLALLGVNLLGLLCLVVGLFFTIPLTHIAFALLYKKLSAETGEGTVSAEKVEETVIDAVVTEAKAAEGEHADA